MKLGENLYGLRKKQKMSQEELAEKMGVSRQSVSKWETGTAYPEMSKILELCKIFHCQLNDLVNETIQDYDSLDEEIKMSVVKFNKEKQRKLKVASKAISICSRILQIATIVISIVLFIGMFFVPSIIKKVEINNDTIIVDKEEVTLEGIASSTVAQVFEDHSTTEIIVYAEIIVVCLIVSVMILSFVMLYLSELFKNISDGDTPFTLDNMKLIKTITILFIAYLLFPDIAGTLFQLFTKIDMNIEYEVAKIFYVLIIVCIYYIFDYGHQIQLDSKGKIYGD